MPVIFRKKIECRGQDGESITNVFYDGCSDTPSKAPWEKTSPDAISVVIKPSSIHVKHSSISFMFQTGLHYRPNLHKLISAYVEQIKLQGVKAQAPHGNIEISFDTRSRKDRAGMLRFLQSEVGKELLPEDAMDVLRPLLVLDHKRAR